MNQIELMKKCTLKTHDDNGKLSLVPVNDTSTKMLRDHFPSINTMVYWQHRSYDHLKLFFAAIQNAYDNWPESYEFQPSDKEHLRAWLIVKAGEQWREVTEIYADDTRFLAKSIELAMNGGSHAFVYALKDKVAVVRPKSIAFKGLSQSDFNDLSNAVSAVLIEVIGLSIEDFKNGVVA